MNQVQNISFHGQTVPVFSHNKKGHPMKLRHLAAALTLALGTAHAAPQSWLHQNLPPQTAAYLRLPNAWFLENHKLAASAIYQSDPYKTCNSTSMPHWKSPCCKTKTNSTCSSPPPPNSPMTRHSNKPWRKPSPRRGKSAPTASNSAASPPSPTATTPPTSACSSAPASSKTRRTASNTSAKTAATRPSPHYKAASIPKPTASTSGSTRKTRSSS